MDSSNQPRPCQPLGLPKCAEVAIANQGVYTPPLLVSLPFFALEGNPNFGAPQILRKLNLHIPIFRVTKSLRGRLTFQKVSGELRLVFATMKFRHFLSNGHQYRLILCGHKVVEAGVACLLLMVQVQLSDITVTHLLISNKTRLLAVFAVRF